MKLYVLFYDGIGMSALNDIICPAFISEVASKVYWQ